MERIDMPRLAKGVAAALNDCAHVGVGPGEKVGEGWVYATNPDWAKWAKAQWAWVCRPDGACLEMKHESGIGRVVVYGRYPRDGTGTEWCGAAQRGPGPHITMNDAKEAHEIAKEVRRRFLSDYLPLYHEGREAAARADAAREDVRAAATELARLAAAELRLGTDVPFFHIYRDRHGGSSLHGSVEVKARDKVALRLDGLKFAQAKALLALLYPVGGVSPGRLGGPGPAAEPTQLAPGNYGRFRAWCFGGWHLVRLLGVVGPVLKVQTVELGQAVGRMTDLTLDQVHPEDRAEAGRLARSHPGHGEELTFDPEGKSDAEEDTGGAG